jgi:hypothetical protein
MSEIESLSEQIDALSEQLGEFGGVVARATASVSGLEAEAGRTKAGFSETGREMRSLSGGIGGGLRRAFEGLALDGGKLSEALQQIGQSVSDGAFRMAMRPVENALGGVIAQGVKGLLSSVSPFAKGGVMAQGRVTPFARGGVVTEPTGFAMRGGRQGLMGEAGPEAIMPLVRGADGKLGVQGAGGGRGVSVVMNVTTPDVQGFQRSQGQIAAQVSRALARGQRNR